MSTSKVLILNSSFLPEKSLVPSNNVKCNSVSKEWLFKYCIQLPINKLAVIEGFNDDEWYISIKSVPPPYLASNSSILSKSKLFTASGYTFAGSINSRVNLFDINFVLSPTYKGWNT